MTEVIIDGVKYVPENQILKGMPTLEQVKLALYSLYWGNTEHFDKYSDGLCVLVTDSWPYRDAPHESNRLENVAEEFLEHLVKIQCFQ